MKYLVDYVLAARDIWDYTQFNKYRIRVVFMHNFLLAFISMLIGHYI